MFKLFNTKRVKLPDRNIEEIKQICKILFIDDKKFEVVDLLKEAGWVNTKRIKDVSSLDSIDIKESNLIFCDVQGVGKALKFQDEGLGLTIALKEKYPFKKIIVYSAEDAGAISAFHKGLSVADARISKNADPYEFQSKVEKYSKEAFSLDECIKRLQKVIYDETGISLETSEIIKSLRKVYSKGSYDVPSIAKVFNLQNAAAVSSIIQLFLTGQS